MPYTRHGRMSKNIVETSLFGLHNLIQLIGIELMSELTLTAKLTKAKKYYTSLEIKLQLWSYTQYDSYVKDLLCLWYIKWKHRRLHRQQWKQFCRCLIQTFKPKKVLWLIRVAQCRIEQKNQQNHTARHLPVIYLPKPLKPSIDIEPPSPPVLPKPRNITQVSRFLSLCATCGASNKHPIF